MSDLMSAPTRQKQAALGGWLQTYPGVDNWENTTLKKGTVIYGGAPGQSNFYTTEEGLQKFGNSRTSMFQALQVKPDEELGFRPGMTAYEVTEDTPAATAITAENTQFGEGGAQQYFIQNYEAVLKPLYSVPLKP